VTATDYVEGLLDRANRRAEAERLALATRVADAEDLPFPDGSFDAVLSTFGVMFTPTPNGPPPT
jgi:ubiquinone/menaquinone biosynthesis C-methylase UbiE